MANQLLILLFSSVIIDCFHATRQGLPPTSSQEYQRPSQQVISLMNFVSPILRHKVPILFIFFISVILAGAGMRHLEFVSDIRVFFSEDNPELKNLNAFERAFAKKRGLVTHCCP